MKIRISDNGEEVWDSAQEARTAPIKWNHPIMSQISRITKIFNIIDELDFQNYKINKNIYGMFRTFDNLDQTRGHLHKKRIAIICFVGFYIKLLYSSS